MGLQMQFLSNENKKKRDLSIYDCDSVCFDSPMAFWINEISTDTYPYVFQKKELYRDKPWKNKVVKGKL